MTPSHFSSEKRKHPRVDNNIPVKISSEDLDIVTETRNLSRTGAYCRINKHLEPMTKIKIHLLLPFKKKDKVQTKKISCHGVVVRSEPAPGQNYFNVAVYFNDIQKKDADSIGQYVSSVMNKDKSSAV